MYVDLQMQLIDTEDQLEDALSLPTQSLCDAFARLDGDILILGVGGKMGPTLAKMARRAIDLAGLNRRVIGASRFSSDELYRDLNECGVDTIQCDLLDEAAVGRLPQVPNVVYLAGRKFGTQDNAASTWATNAYVPGLVAQRFARSRIVALSTGNVYPLWPIDSPGPSECDPVGPIGEYAQSCLARERIFEFFSSRNGTSVSLVRLNYAVELRYGVLLDVGRRVYNRQPVDLAMGHANIIWQRDANEAVLRSLEICASPPEILNLAGPMVSIRDLAERFGRAFGVEPVFTGTESRTALLSNGAKYQQLFGPPMVLIDQMIKWVTHWILINGHVHDLPTHYDQREGQY